MRAPVLSSRPIHARAVPSVLSVLRAVVVLAGWAGLGLAGWVVAHRHGGARVQFAIAFAVILVAIWIALLVWVRRNEGIHRRKGPRRAVPVPPSRQVVPMSPARRVGEVVLRRSADGHKVYEPVELPR